MTGCIIVVKNSILRAPRIRSLSLNILPPSSHTPRNVAVDDLTVGDEFSMHNTADVERKMPSIISQNKSLFIQLIRKKHKFQNLRSEHSDVIRYTIAQPRATELDRKHFGITSSKMMKISLPAIHYETWSKYDLLLM